MPEDKPDVLCWELESRGARGNLMPIPTIEKDLLRIFRIFVALRLLLSALLTLRYVRDGDGGMVLFFGLNSLLGTYLLLHLSSGHVRRWFGRAYLPIPLLLSTLSVILEQRVTQVRMADSAGVVTTILFGDVLSAIAEPGTQPPLIVVVSTAFLFVPLVLISWQYNFRAVVYYTVVTLVLDVALLLGLMVEIEPKLFIEETFISLFRGLSFLIVGYIVATLVAAKREQQAALEKANAQLRHYAATLEQLATTRERNRLARELHDTMAHTFSAVTIKLNAVHLIWEQNPQKAGQMLAEVLESMNDGMTETRRALHDLRATPLEDLGLVLALRQLAETAADRSGSALHLQLPDEFPEVPFAVEQGLYRIAQEALENTVKHADAQRMEVTLRVDAERIRLCIADDGRGFAPEQDGNDHYGIQGMKERADMLGAALRIDSQPQQGTQVEVVVERPR